MSDPVSTNYGSRGHVSRTNSSWVDLQRKSNDEDKKVQWSPYGLWDDARKNMHMQTNAVSS